MQRCEDLLQELDTGQSVLCAESGPVESLAVVFAGILKGCGVFLANPQWGPAEWKQVADLTAFHHVRGTCPLPPDPGHAPVFHARRILIPSGGTTGRLKFCVHDLDTLSASVRSLYRYHHEKPLTGINPLPVFHVSGWMPVVRACLTGGRVRLVSWKLLETGNFPGPAGEHCALSLVPAQLARLAGSEAGLGFLHGLDAIYLGGAAPSAALVNRIRTEKLPVLFVYGSTETASMVLAGTRAESNASGSIWGSPLPGVEVELTEEREMVIRTPSLFRGYYPEDNQIAAWASGDIGRQVSEGNIQVEGRKDFLINSGGEKVNPEEVEAAFCEVFPEIGFAVGGVPHEVWGQELVALVDRELSAEEREDVRRKLSGRLAPYKIPKRFVPVAGIPRSPAGKINRNEVNRRLSALEG